MRRVAVQRGADADRGASCGIVAVAHQLTGASHHAEGDHRRRGAAQICAAITIQARSGSCSR